MTYEGRNAGRNRSAEPLPLGYGAPLADDDSLGATEWAVVVMARVDGPRRGGISGVLRRLMDRLAGMPPPRPIANRRLEILRRFANAAWFRDEIPTRHMRALFSVGFSSSDAARIIAHVATVRGMAPEVEAWP